MASNYETSQIFGTVLALDVFESTILTLQYGDVVTVRMNQDFDEFLKIAKEFDGELNDRRGDGLRLVFQDASKALFAAYRMQLSAGYRNSIIGADDPRVTHRIGLFYGEITALKRSAEDETFYDGEAFIRAARIEAFCVPGEVFMSKGVYDAVRQNVPFVLRDLGAHRFKNMGNVTMHVWSTCIDPRWAIPLTDVERETYYAEREKDRVRREKAAQVERDKEQLRLQERERIRIRKMEEMRAAHRAADARNRRRWLAVMIPAVLGIAAWNWGIREPDQVHAANSFLIRMLGGTEVTKEKIRSGDPPAVKKGAAVVVPKPEKSVRDSNDSKPTDEKLISNMETVVPVTTPAAPEEPTPAKPSAPEPTIPENPDKTADGVIIADDDSTTNKREVPEADKPNDEPTPELRNPHQDLRPGN
jgi:class 3 adenylate cyclase